MNAAIAQHLNVVETAIVRIEEWANVLFVVVRGIGARFVSKKVAKVTKPSKMDEAQRVAGILQSSGFNAKVWSGGKVVRVYVGKGFIEVKKTGLDCTKLNNYNAYSVVRDITIDCVDAVDVSASGRKMVDLDYEMYNPNGMYYG